MTKVRIHVICADDRVMFAVVSDAKRAQQKMAELKKEYFAANKWRFASLEQYNHVLHWHVREVAGEQPLTTKEG